MILSFAIPMFILSLCVMKPAMTIVSTIEIWWSVAHEVARGFNSPFKQYRERPGQNVAAAAVNEDKKVKSKLKAAGFNNEYENFSPGSFSEWLESRSNRGRKAKY